MKYHLEQCIDVIYMVMFRIFVAPIFLETKSIIRVMCKRNISKTIIRISDKFGEFQFFQVWKSNFLHHFTPFYITTFYNFPVCLRLDSKSKSIGSCNYVSNVFSYSEKIA